MKTGIFSYIITIILISVPWGCGRDTTKIIGSWQSVSIENPAPLFKNTLPDRKVGSVKLIIGPEGNFKWIDSNNGPRVAGTYSIEKGALLLTPANDEETVQLSFTTEKERLVLKTDDGFTFVFSRIPDNK